MHMATVHNVVVGKLLIPISFLKYCALLLDEAEKLLLLLKEGEERSMHPVIKREWKRLLLPKCLLEFVAAVVVVVVIQTSHFHYNFKSIFSLLLFVRVKFYKNKILKWSSSSSSSSRMKRRRRRRDLTFIYLKGGCKTVHQSLSRVF